jgi:RNA binding exosome subunit
VTCIVYLNDILVYSNTEEEHKLYVKEVLQRLREAKLYLKLSKCKFYTQETKYLGYIVCLEGVKINPLRIKTI